MISTSSFLVIETLGNNYEVEEVNVSVNDSNEKHNKYPKKISLMILKFKYHQKA
jgi:hypothetical protein